MSGNIGFSNSKKSICEEVGERNTDLYIVRRKRWVCRVLY